MSRSCLKCGTKVSNDVTTCTSCGQPIKPVEPIEEKSNNTIFYIVLGIIIGIIVLVFAVIIPLVTDGYKEIFAQLNASFDNIKGFL